MKNQLQHIKIKNFTTELGAFVLELNLSYQVFGQDLGSAPIILINHALTGNSQVTGKKGWWQEIVGKEKVIDTNVYTVLSFNIPGNGFDGFLIENSKDFIARDVANIFLEGLYQLEIPQLFALVGGSLGGGIAWEMMVLNTKIAKHFLPIATDWKSTDWLIANCQIQEQFLVNSSNPVHDARMHAMLCYRTPSSFKERFQRSKKDNSTIFNVESWLLHHGEKLQERYQLSSYKLMNQLLKTIDVTNNGEKKIEILDKIEANIHIIGVDSDLFFTAEENRETHKVLALTKENVTYNEIKSMHGHDAFLMEYEQLLKIIAPIFNKGYEAKRMNVLKLGVTSLVNGKGIENTMEISRDKRKDQIAAVLFKNIVTEKNVSLVVEKEQLYKGVHAIKSQVFGNVKKINIAVFGKGLVGGTLIHQILESTAAVLERRKIQLNVFAVASSKKVLLNKNGVTKNWEQNLEELGQENTSIKDIIEFAKTHHLENLIAVDNTASITFVENYIPLITAGFDLVSCNKIGNTLSFDFYKEVRIQLKEYKKQYLYETNVGAGLPLIDTIRLLHESGENITKIRGVFSGSLSYLFNTFSEENLLFSEVLKDAMAKGYTEPDAREDLCGNDVARKLLILARELELENELIDVNIQNLIPENLRTGTVDDFMSNLSLMNAEYQQLKDSQEQQHVLRYIGELSGDLSKDTGSLEVKLVSVSKNSPLGSLKGSDVIFEIYTESYGEQPIVIQGAGAGAKVTARGVFGDVLRLAKQHN